MAQLERIGVEKIVKFAQVCKTKKFSTASATHLFEYCSQPQNLAAVLVEAATICDVGKPFMSACYNLETKHPAIFAAHDVLQELEQAWPYTAMS